MEERNPMEGKARIVGLDLSKKTFVGCNLTGERFEKSVRANRKGKIRVSRKGTMNSQEKRDIKPY